MKALQNVFAARCHVAPLRLPGHHAKVRPQLGAAALRHATSSIDTKPVVDVRQAAGTPKCDGIALVWGSVDYSFYQEMDPADITAEWLWESFLPNLRYLSSKDQGQVRDALNLACYAHAGQYRKSGEPFVTHPLEVARILAELRAEPVMLIAGLLHDTVEDTDRVTLKTIEEQFGTECARIVEGETKFSKLGEIHSSITKEELQAMDLQQLFLAMTEDFRITVVKLADRLHNMRTMASMPPHKQKKIADETLRVFAPLAGLLGLWRIKCELEDLSLKYSFPATYQMLKVHRDRQLTNQAADLHEAEQALLEAVSADIGGDGHAVRVLQRPRSLYSIFKQARAQACKKLSGMRLDDYGDRQVVTLIKLHRLLDSVTDVAKLNVVIGSPDDADPATANAAQLCYRVLGLVHSLWAPVPASIKDFIATPKRNGYTGLHTVLLTRGCQVTRPVEVVIHTEAMHWLAEFGIAADAWVREAEDTWRCKPTQRPRIELEGQERSSSGASANGSAAVNGTRVLGANGVSSNGAVPANGAARQNGAARANGAAPSNGVAPTNGVANGTANGKANGSADGGQCRPESLPTIGKFVQNGVSLGALWEAASPLFAPFVEPFGRTGAGEGAREREGSNPGGGQGGTELPAVGAAAAPAAAKASTTKLGDSAIARRVNWLQSIRLWQQEFLGAASATEFVNVIQQDLLTQTVFCFTPAGDIRRLPQGATVVDFAYHIHSEVGNSMVSARVNGAMVGADYELCNADVVEIIQYAPAKERRYNIRRHREWLPLARTQSARHKLVKFLRTYDSEDEGPDNGCEEVPLTTAWITLECKDRSGILGDVATTIAGNGGNIEEHSGGNVAVQRRTGYMAFKVTAPKDALDTICKKLRSVEAVQDLYMGRDKSL